jgi:hypothetical protein
VANHKTILSPHGRFSLQLNIIFYYSRSIANREARPSPTAPQVAELFTRRNATERKLTLLDRSHYLSTLCIWIWPEQNRIRYAETRKVICNLHPHHRHRHRQHPSTLFLLIFPFFFLASPCSYPLVSLSRTLSLTFGYIIGGMPFFIGIGVVQFLC